MVAAGCLLLLLAFLLWFWLGVGASRQIIATTSSRHFHHQYRQPSIREIIVWLKMNYLLLLLLNDTVNQLLLECINNDD